VVLDLIRDVFVLSMQSDISGLADEVHVLLRIRSVMWSLNITLGVNLNARVEAEVVYHTIFAYELRYNIVSKR
jgi:hypothetical protein